MTLKDLDMVINPNMRVEIHINCGMKFLGLWWQLMSNDVFGENQFIIDGITSDILKKCDYLIFCHIKTKKGFLKVVKGEV